MIVEDRRPRAPAIADAEQQHVGRRLAHGQAADHVHVMTRSDDAVDAHAEQPRDDTPCEHVHVSASFSTSSTLVARVSFMNSSSSMPKLPITATPIARFTITIRPPE